MVKNILKNILSPSLIREVKRNIRRAKNMLKKADKTSLSDFKKALAELGVQQGDKVFVTSGFANLNAKGYSPEDAIRALMETVGQEGLIMMPYYPPVNSMDWVKSGEVFDMRTTVSGMGVMTNVFSHMEGVVKSAHPTKAVCVWGKNAEQYASLHYESEDPYGDNTPYGRLLATQQSKSLSLGVVNLPMFHAIEDKYQQKETLYYAERIFDVPLRKENGEEIICHTKVHDPAKSAHTMMGGEFAKRFSEPIRKFVRFGYDNLYLIDNTLLAEAARKEFALGHTREKGRKI
ncbi:MAG: AAC(3) family N-acetyltransferase [Paludibacteraceae bacterium]|nr:AAC(3) family N-acetyltransferase [Paludibacteraceae bacterium]